MKKYNSIDDVWQWLEAIPNFQTSGLAAARMGIERVAAFCKRLGNVHTHYPVIHVAGTNGKGSVSAMLASVYQKAGFTTGLYTSPHLISVHERIRCNGFPITDEEILRFFQQEVVTSTTEQLTYFEWLTVLAFWFFSQKKTDIAIIETGLGGRMDATNIVESKLGIITSIGLDHTDYLGDTLQDIAREKAGIIKQNTPIIVGNLATEAINVIQKRAQECHAPWHPISETDVLPEPGGFRSKQGRYFALPYAQHVQRYNIAMVEKAVAQLAPQFPVSDSEMETGISKAFDLLPGRMEKIHPENPWFFDGAHNAEAIEYLGKHLKELGAESEKSIIFAVMSDKATPQFLSEWKSYKRLYYFELSNPRAAKYKEIQQHLPHCKRFPETLENVKIFLDDHKSDLLMFTGSYYFYSTVRSWMKLSSPN